MYKTSKAQHIKMAYLQKKKMKVVTTVSQHLTAMLSVSVSMFNFQFSLRP